MKEAVLRRIQQLENRCAEMGGPVDGLSASLWEEGQRLAALDDLGLMAEGAELGLDLDTMKRMQRNCAPPLWRCGNQ